ncbi:MAG TPA: isoprenylcysteine carboxylmethyltransferase family protein [Acidobacteriota bacterium]|jgi:protein-S-isoprenylcysteine O-methyltransferase Ste14|nr:isoprenylcysteine carboxylmethyltransferase family protein [Acidobacteriota bacterium]
MRTLFIALRALVYMSAFLLLWWWIALRFRVRDSEIGTALPAWTGIIGIAAMAAGAVLVLLCGGVFVVLGRGTPAIFDAPRKFVAVGPYKYARNPMYVGALMVLSGFALYEHSISMLLLAPLMFLTFHLFVIYYEEPNLRRKFGATYEAYCKAVPRWIPRGS